MYEEKLAEVVEEGKKEIEECSGIDQREQDLKEPLGSQARRQGGRRGQTWGAIRGRRGRSGKACKDYR